MTLGPNGVQDGTAAGIPLKLDQRLYIPQTILFLVKPSQIIELMPHQTTKDVIGVCRGFGCEFDKEERRKTCIVECRK